MPILACEPQRYFLVVAIRLRFAAYAHSLE